MIFWVLTGIAILGVIAVYWFFIYEDGWGYGLGMGTLVGTLIGMGWILVAMLGVATGLNHLVGANTVEESKSDLQALNSGDSISGHFFLGSGTIGGQQVLSFIKINEDGSFTPDQVPGRSSAIYEEDGSDPAMTEYRHIADHWWLAPPVRVATHWTFTVPTGSVVNTYEVTP